MPPWIATLAAVCVILVLCLLGLSFGLLLGRKSVRSCGRAADADGEELTCPSCAGRGGCPSRKLSKPD